MFTVGFFLPNVGRMRVMVSQVHIFHQLMGNIFLLEIYLDLICPHLVVGSNIMRSFANIANHISQHGAFYL
jgi:hypothetical protein